MIANKNTITFEGACDIKFPGIIIGRCAQLQQLLSHDSMKISGDELLLSVIAITLCTTV